MKTVVYTKPGCGQCRFVMRWLDSRKIPYQKVNIQEDAESMDKVQNSEFTSLPIVEIDGKLVFNGFNETKLESNFG